MRPGLNRLEPENAIAAKLGMSRETVRKAMGSLIEEGCITRVQGLGNFGHPEVARLPMRIDRNSDFRRLLSAGGGKVESFCSASRTRAPSEAMLSRMPEAEGSEVVAFELSYESDSRPAILASVELLSECASEGMPEGKYSGNLKSFLRESCGYEGCHTATWLLAERCARAASLFGLARGEPLLAWEEVYYDLRETKLGYVKVWFNAEVVDLSLLLSF